MRNYFEIKDKKIYYKLEGKGKSIVLLHGFPESLNIWDDFSRELSKTFQVLSIDLPGFGKSDTIAEVHSMPLMAEVVRLALDINNIKECVMIGHSMGGYVTLAFAEKYPKLLKGFGMFHSHALPDSDEGKENRNRVIEAVKKNHKNFISNIFPELFAPHNIPIYNKEIEKLIQQGYSTSPESLVAAMTGMRDREDKRKVLKNAACPVLFIFGRHDKRLPVDTALQQAALPDTSEIHILGNISHMGFIEAKNETLLIIRTFSKKYL